MEEQKYLKLIDNELSKLPDYVHEFYLSNHHSVTTAYQYLTEIRRFFDWLRSSKITDAKTNKDISLTTLEQLRRNDIMLYIDFLEHQVNKQGKLNTPTTINRSINALRSLYHYLTVVADNNDGEPYFYRNVMLKIQSLKSTETLNYRAHQIEAHMLTGDLKYQFLDYIEKDYVKSLNNYGKHYFEQNKERDLAIIALLLATGIRVSECANSNLNQLNLKAANLDVMRKGGQKDTVPIAQWALPYLSDYLEIRKNRYQPEENEKALFLARTRGKINRIASNSIENFVGKYSKAFGHPLTPHKLRHTLASELYAVTKDQVLVAQQLGQKGTSATDLYTHVDQNKQREALATVTENYEKSKDRLS